MLDTDGIEVALISKKWMGCFKETLTDADNFVIDFNEGLILETKILIFAATFLIDMMYFEMNNWLFFYEIRTNYVLSNYDRDFNI